MPFVAPCRTLEITAPLRWLRLGWMDLTRAWLLHTRRPGSPARAAGFATALIGFLVLLPIIGYATWHAYKETIDASAWPKNSPAEDA